MNIHCEMITIVKLMNTSPYIVPFCMCDESI